MSVKAACAATDTVFTKEELEKIITFCQKMGLDYGELDSIRNSTDQKLYIVDANNTPTIRFVGFTYPQKRWIMRQLREAFEQAFLG